MPVSANRLIDGPIISPSSDPSIGNNIQGPSLIKVPSWVTAPLGQYYLYFADHKGKYIRLAYADEITGPWHIHVPGSLRLEHSLFPVDPPSPTAQPGNQQADFEDRISIPAERSHDAHLEASFTHIASPDVHVRKEAGLIVMYYHGLESYGKQSTRVAVSRDGIAFKAYEEILGRTYFRVFDYQSQYFALAMPGLIYRSQDGYSNFEAGPLLFNKDMRHTGVFRVEDTLYVFWTQVGHVPERILLSTIDLRSDWQQWQASEPVEVLRPEHPFEGADAPLEQSIRSTAYGHVNQLRDPAVYVEGNTIYLLYAVAGESGIAIAQVSIT